MCSLQARSAQSFPVPLYITENEGKKEVIAREGFVVTPSLYASLVHLAHVREQSWTSRTQQATTKALSSTLTTLASTDIDLLFSG
jgi:hypothetical protein